MSASGFRRRLVGNPYSWLLAALLVCLVLMWQRERRLLDYELEKSPTLRIPKGPFSGLKIPPFNDPFGNMYWVEGEFTNDPDRMGGPPYTIFIQSYEWDGSYRRGILLMGKLIHVLDPPGARDIPPILFAVLLPAVTVLWFRRGQQRRESKP